MKNIFNFLFFVLILFSCTTESNQSQDSKNKILGNWEAVVFNVGFISGGLEVVINDTTKLPHDLLSNEFLLELSSDSSYLYKSNLGKKREENIKLKMILYY